MVFGFSWFHTGNALHAATFALITAVALGVLGREIGGILDRPMGHRDKTPAFIKALFESPFKEVDEDDEYGDEPVNMDEVFLDELGKPAETVSP